MQGANSGNRVVTRMTEPLVCPLVNGTRNLPPLIFVTTIPHIIQDKQKRKKNDFSRSLINLLGLYILFVI
jgi:hypothetical protein